MTMKEIIEAAVSSPVEERAMVADAVLRSLDAPESEMDRKWARLAQRRLSELRSGQTTPVPAEEVFAKIWKHRLV